ncbi:MAG: AAA family ATPase [Candidatus Bipolaricaulaceae bacterium]
MREVAAQGEQILAQVERAVVGKRAELELILATILAGGHVLLEDYPGLAKTLTARCFAQVLGLSFHRIQFTPDLLPADIVGTNIYRRGAEEFEFRPGPVFAQIVLADEINRATPKTQSALLEAMQEGQVTTEGQTRALPQPFAVLATQNPIEYEGTFPLPEAQLDRFLSLVRLGYPSREQEVEILRRRIGRRREEVQLEQIADAKQVLAMRAALEDVLVDPDLLEYMAALVHHSRRHGAVAVGASPRGSLALLRLSRARAALRGRDFVLPDDVKEVAVPALAHRLILSPDLWAKEVRTEDVVRDLLEQVPVPKAG